MRTLTIKNYDGISEHGRSRISIKLIAHGCAITKSKEEFTYAYQSQHCCFKHPSYDGN
jgi:hypothetical protein